MLRKIHNDSPLLKKNWLLNAPRCYIDKLASMEHNDTSVHFTQLNEKSDLKMLEDMCDFKELVRNCRIRDEFMQRSTNEHTNVIVKN